MPRPETGSLHPVEIDSGCVDNEALAGIVMHPEGDRTSQAI
jgi:hypothetical protein